MRGSSHALELLLIVATASTACSSGGQASCDSSFTLQPLFAVTNAATGRAICNATVVPTDEADAGNAQSDQVSEGGAGCEYSTVLLPGSDVVVVSAPGFGSAMVTVVVKSVPCFDTPPAPTPPTVDVALTPN